MKRIEQGVTRPAQIAVEIDGARVMVHPGETVAVAVLASASQRFRDDRSGAARGMFCNMGTCSECTVWAAVGTSPWRRLRGCLVPVEPSLRISTRDPESRP
ncbi:MULTISPECIES: 2Fe-2S iron-sulfur cluster-binding protein [unclassified Novosphingobium]|uniref:2Fe-2S iron-sulfur cluster-binding protein n=1 Tax=unclassified Novosphingobium TaxID=2644732 RepID=UPI00135998B5|nr:MULTISPECIES: 2Fe-2S iron-sulfur cluster-binding protein [unclassified Novosphingobium]